MAGADARTDPQPARDGRHAAGEEVGGASQVFTGVVGSRFSDDGGSGSEFVFLLFQVRIPSKTDKPGGSPTREATKEVRPGPEPQGSRQNHRDPNRTTRVQTEAQGSRQNHMGPDRTTGVQIDPRGSRQNQFYSLEPEKPSWPSEPVGCGRINDLLPD